MGVPVEGAQVEAVAQYSCEETTPTYPDSPVPPCYVDQILGASRTDGGGHFTIGGLPQVYLRLDVHKDGNTVSQGVYVSQDSSVSLILP
jgi:hypothetical protein